MFWARPRRAVLVGSAERSRPGLPRSARPPRSRTGPSTPAALAGACPRTRPHRPAGSGHTVVAGSVAQPGKARPRRPAPPAARHQMAGGGLLTVITIPASMTGPAQRQAPRPDQAAGPRQPPAHVQPSPAAPQGVGPVPETCERTVRCSAARAVRRQVSTAPGSVCGCAKTRERRRESGVTEIPSRALLTCLTASPREARYTL